MKNKEYIIKILNYTLIKETLESSFSIMVTIKKDKYVYELKYPSNPIIDCYFINYNNKSIENVINFIDLELIIPLEKDNDNLQLISKFNDFKEWLHLIRTDNDITLSNESSNESKYNESKKFL